MTDETPPLAEMTAELRQLSEAATPGPWRVNKGGLNHPAWVCYSDKERAKIEHANSVGSLVWASDEDEQKEDPHRDVRFRGGAADEVLIAFLRNHVDEFLATLESAQRSPKEGHNQPCYYCGEPCNSVAGNPGLWPVALCHSDDPGVVKYHHHDCVAERLESVPALRAALKRMRARYVGAIEEGMKVERECETLRAVVEAARVVDQWATDIQARATANGTQALHDALAALPPAPPTNTEVERFRRDVPGYVDMYQEITKPPAPPVSQVLQPYAGTVWRHKKRGTLYTMLGTADVQVTDCILEGHQVIVYRAEIDGSLWVRPTEEFYDGRFEQVPLPPAPDKESEV